MIKDADENTLFLGTIENQVHQSPRRLPSLFSIFAKNADASRRSGEIAVAKTTLRDSFNATAGFTGLSDPVARKL